MENIYVYCFWAGRISGGASATGATASLVPFISWGPQYAGRLRMPRQAEYTTVLLLLSQESYLHLIPIHTCTYTYLYRRELRKIIKNCFVLEIM